MSVPNQKKIYIERSSDNARKDFFKVSNRNLNIAMYNLQPNAFKLWVYFADNANGYEMDLYPCNFCTIADVSRSTYDRAFTELELKGYLVKSEKAKNVYLFKEISDNKEYNKLPDEVNSIDADCFEEVKRKYFD